MASDTPTKEGYFWRPVHGTGLPNHPEESTSRQYAVPALLFCALFALWFAVSGRQSLDAYREQVNRLDMRRRHGIPDTDNRPFSVAYRDVCVQKAKEESQRVRVEDERRRMEQTQSHNKENFWPGATEVRGVLPGIPRSRQDPAAFSPHVHFITPTRSASNTEGSEIARPESYSNPDVSVAQAQSVQERLQASPAEFTQLIPLYLNSAKRAAHSDFNSTPPVPPQFAKSQANTNTPRETLMRGSKRQFSDPAASETLADKRIRIDDHEEMDIWPSTRGKKRNWETESDAGTEGTSRGASELQKRRLDVRRPASLDYRGRKRDRSDTGSLIGDSDTPHSRKRGKIYDGSDDIELLDGIDEEDEDDDVIFDSGGSYSDVDDDASMDDDDPLPFLTDPVIQGRAIGEEWEINKQRYRVGSNGKRERYVLVKGMENKFNMPRDSLHPDALTMIQIVSPLWLTDDEYHDARSRQELAWQDSTFQIGEATTTRAHRGKNLLWSASSPGNSPIKKAFRTSPVVTSSNPLDSSRRGMNGRSAYAPPTSGSPSAAIGGQLRHGNSLSKWEKQDAEAVALARIRNPPQRITALPQGVGPVGLKAGSAAPTHGDLKDTSVSVSTPAPTSKDDSGIVPHGNPSTRPPAVPLTPPTAVQNTTTTATSATPHSTTRVQKSQAVLPTLVGQRSAVSTGLSAGPSVSPMFFAKPPTLTTESQKDVSVQSTRNKSFTNGDLSKATLGQEEVQSNAPLDKASEIPSSKTTSTDKKHLPDTTAPSTGSLSSGLINPNPITTFGESKSLFGVPFEKTSSMDGNVAPKLPQGSDGPSDFSRPPLQEPKSLEVPYQSKSAEVNSVAPNSTGGSVPTSGGIFGRAIRGLPVIKPNAVGSTTAQNLAPSFKFGPAEVATKHSSPMSTEGTQHPFSFGTPPTTVSGPPQKEPANPPLQFGFGSATNAGTSNFTFGSTSNQKTS